MKEELFYNSEETYAMHVIQDFFDFYGLHGSIKYIDRLVYHAIHSKFYNQGAPYNMVFFVECFRKIVSACLILEKAHVPIQFFEVQPGEKGMPDLERKEDFMPTHTAMSWNYLPRHVDIAQYLNPMLSLKQFRKYKTEGQWMKTFDELLEYSLSNATIQNCLPPYNIMKIRKILLQLVEGSYLILIRYEKYQKETNIVAAHNDTNSKNSEE